MVKGVTRRVIVVKSPEPDLFDEAFFIVNGDASSGVTQEELLQEAQRVAGNYLRADLGKKPKTRFPPVFFFALGAALTGLCWLVTALFL